ncbi:MAG: hypothetical protein ONB44_00790 [candidate division KSB1 bacterium]|nr:hypothetical protein [candidate division KSB1 bacterium]
MFANSPDGKFRPPHNPPCPTPQLIEQHINRRQYQQRNKGRKKQSADDGAAMGKYGGPSPPICVLPYGRSRGKAAADQARWAGGHQNWPQTITAGLDDGVVAGEVFNA